MFLLSLLIFVPVVYGLMLLFVPKSQVKFTALLFSLSTFILSTRLFREFDPSRADLQLVEKFSWVKAFGINYFVGIDGISFWLVLLTTFLMPITILGSWKAVEKNTRAFHANLMFLQSALIGTFLAFDAILFYVFFEASLIPMYFLIGLWGGPRKIYASVKFFIYTMFGSVFMLLAIITMMIMTQTLDGGGGMSASLLDFYKLDIPFIGGTLINSQTLLFFAFCLAFAIKCPMFPVHTWLPDAHVEAPTAGSVLLAGVMLKMGTYGFLRFVLPMFPEATAYWSWLLMLLAVIGIIYGALVAMVQPDIKKLVAYSSVSHMGYVILGLFTLNEFGVTGGLYQMLNHGVSTGALFLLVGMVYERTHNREISKYGGLAKAAPWFTICFMIITLSSIAVPMTNGFIGEFLILLGAFQANSYLAGAAVLGVVLGATYMLWMVKRVFFGSTGELVEKYNSKLEMNWREGAVIAPLIILVFWMGLLPNHFLNWSKASLEHLLQNKNNYTLSYVTESTPSINGKKMIALKDKAVK